MAVTITVEAPDKLHKLEVKSGESLMDALLGAGYFVSAVCGGKGRCGKCKVRVTDGEAAVSSGDLKFFSERELAAGWRLSCTLYPQADMSIALGLQEEKNFAAVSAFTPEAATAVVEAAVAEGGIEAEGSRGYHIAVDIGTTTIAFQLLDGRDNGVLHTVTTVNHQRKYGADVVSRMQASIDGKGEELQEIIRRDLQEGIEELLAGYGRQFSREHDTDARESTVQVRRIIISCNTTMGHLLMGYACDSLGVYPFTPVNIDLINCQGEELFQGIAENLPGDSKVLPLQYRDARVTILPGISTFVGGDIVSGIYACGLHKSKQVSLLVDLGTNGEMALGNGDKILVTSTAAGPAFEGGNITWGMGSVPGAICSVKLDGGTTKAETIQNQSPVGICGTGVIEAVAELLREGILDETGLLAEEYFEDGFPLACTAEGELIVLTQKDIRELQLAKAAVRAGIETLLLRYGIGKEDVTRVYLAGGFGYSLDVDKAIAIGMLPEEFRNKTLAVGNSSLAGAAKYLREAGGEAVLQEIVAKAQEIGLSLDADFNELYMEAMMFA